MVFLGDPYSGYRAAATLAGIGMLGLQPSGVRPGGYAANGGMTRRGMKGRRSSKKSGGTTAVVRRIVRGMEETKIFSSGNTAALIDGLIYTKGITQPIIQGTAEGTRISDSINLQWLKAKIVFNTAAVSGAFTYRILVVYHEVQKNPPFDTTGLVYADLFLPNGLTASANVQSITNKKGVTVLWDSFIDINSVVATTADCATVDVNVSLKSAKFPYVTAAAVYGKVKQLYLVVIPHVIGGTVGTTSCGSASLTFAVGFKDA